MENEPPKYLITVTKSKLGAHVLKEVAVLIEPPYSLWEKDKNADLAMVCEDHVTDSFENTHGPAVNDEIITVSTKRVTRMAQWDHDHAPEKFHFTIVAESR